MSAVLLLILSILSSASLNVIFKLFQRYGIRKFHAIAINYLVCFALGWSLSSERSLLANAGELWFMHAFALGSLFILIFLVMAQTVDKLGISINAVSSKMAVVIPLLLSFITFKEPLHPLFLLGLILSLLSIYFISMRAEVRVNPRYIWLPIIVFLGSGIIDSALKLLEHHYGSDVGFDTISYTIFLGAFSFGTLILLIRGQLHIWRTKDLLAGIALGIPNYFSIFFLLSALAAFSQRSALVFAINNASIVLVSTLFSVLLFKETLSRMNRLGLAIAIVSILLIAYVN